MKKTLPGFLTFKVKMNNSRLFNKPFSGLVALLLILSNVTYGQLGCETINAGTDVTINCQESANLQASIIAYPLSATTSYVIEQPTCPLPSLSGGTASNLTIDDQWSGVIPLPFAFGYYGNTYNNVVIGANGQLSFNTALAGGYNGWAIGAGDQIPTTATNFPLNTIYGAFHDMDPSVNPDPTRINYYVTGTAPFRIWVLNFNAVPHFSCNNLITGQQILLYETLNVVEVNIFDKPVCSTWNGGRATLGLTGNNLSEYSVPPGRNTGVWAASNETWRFIPAGAQDPNTSFQWTDESGNVIGTDLALTVSPTQTTTYTATFTYQIGGTNQTVSDDVTVTVTGNFSVDLGTDQDFCDVDSYTITPQITGVDPTNASYVWSTGETTPTITVSSTGTYSVDVTVGGCTSSGSVFIEFKESPVVDLGGDFQTCFDNQVVLDATPSNFPPSDASYEWFFNGTPLTDSQFFLEVFVSGTYSVVVTVDNCSSEDSITISPRTDVEVSLGADITACANSVVTLTAQTAEPGVNYTWFLDGEVIPGENLSTLDITVPSVTSNLSQLYKVTIAKGQCVASDEVEVTAFNCVITQGISPDGSVNQNDNFNLEFLAARTGIENLKIYNRQGLLVYERNNYVNEWIGQSDKGDSLPSGTYFYVIHFSGEDVQYGRQTNGWIYVNRAAN